MGRHGQPALRTCPRDISFRSSATNPRIPCWGCGVGGGILTECQDVHLSTPVFLLMMGHGVGRHLQGPQSKGQAWYLLTRQECSPQLQTTSPSKFPASLSLDAMDKRQKTKFKAKVLTCTQGPGGQHPAIMASEGHFFAWLCFDYVRDGLGVTVWLC